MKDNIFGTAVFPYSGLMLIIISFILLIFIDPIEANFFIYIWLPLFPVYFLFLASLVIGIYAIKLILMGFFKYIKNTSTIAIKTKSANDWYLAGKLILLSIGLFWIGLMIHNYFFVLSLDTHFVFHGEGGFYLDPVTGWLIPNFSYFLFTFIFIISPLITFILLYIGYLLHNKYYEQVKEVRDELSNDVEWLKYQHYVLKRSVQEIANDLGVSMIKIKTQLDELN